MANERYDGWANYETWCVNLWLSSDLSRYWDDAAQDAWDDAEDTKIWTRKESACFALAGRMKEEFSEASPLNDGGSMYSDMLNAALSEVNWHEIAYVLLAEIAEEETEEETEEVEA